MSPLAMQILPAPKNIKVTQGEYRISTEKDVILSAVLGSCVATCIWDARSRVGGMNHFLLPFALETDDPNLSHGCFSMELLINELMKAGARRSRLQAKIFGGANLIRSSYRVGERNAEFARSYLMDEGIEIVSSDIGGSTGRLVEFFPANGRARVLKIQPGDWKIVQAEKLVAEPAPKDADEGSVELF